MSQAFHSLTLADVGVRVRDAQLLHGVDLQVPAGHITTLIGPNGAGKSTLLRVMAGLRTPTAGAALLDGVALSDTARQDRARLIAWMSQFPPADLPLTLRGYVALGRRPALGAWGRQHEEDPVRIDAALRRFALQDLAHCPWRRLSGGERQRAALARLVVQDAPIWLLDEPANHLDLKHLALLGRMLREERDAGRTIVTVLHDLTQAAQLADYVVLMQGGLIVAQGPVESVIEPERLAGAYDWPVQVHNGAGGWHVQALP